MKSYYIKAIHSWIICVNADKFVDMNAKDAIRKQWCQQDHTVEDVIVLDQSIAPFDSLVNQVPLSILKKVSKLLNNQS